MHTRHHTHAMHTSQGDESTHDLCMQQHRNQEKHVCMHAMRKYHHSMTPTHRTHANKHPSRSLHARTCMESTYGIITPHGSANAARVRRAGLRRAVTGQVAGLLALVAQALRASGGSGAITGKVADGAAVVASACAGLSAGGGAVARQVTGLAAVVAGAA